jgi:hypothetical protein
MKSTWFFVTVSAFILALLLFLSSRTNVPALPHDALHNEASMNGKCLDCHGPGKQRPLKSTHPPKEQCLICHRK